MTTQTIEQITTALQKLMYFSYVAFLKTNQGFEIEDERNGYESEQFTEDIQEDCGIEFSRATTERYGADYTLHYSAVGWLADLLTNHDLPLIFTSHFPNQGGGDQENIIDARDTDCPIEYDIDKLVKLSDDELLAIHQKLHAQITFLKLKYQ